MKKRIKIYIGADHAGFKLKGKLKKYFDKNLIEYEDVGGNGNKKDDYLDYAFLVGKNVVKDKNYRGVLICGTGTGMVIAANKVKGVRAAVGYDNYSIIMGKKHNDTNVLCLRGRKFSDEKNIRLVRLWLKERFSGKERHRRRLRKIEEFERLK